MMAVYVEGVEEAVRRYFEQFLLFAWQALSRSSTSPHRAERDLFQPGHQKKDKYLHRTSICDRNTREILD
jgi:hypothetical protein